MNESEIPTRLRDFTPLPDILVSKYGVITAAVWGKIWRYTQMRRGKCDASLETIAKELNLSVRTIIRHVQELESGKYIIDKTPDLKNKPHSYTTTNKVNVEITIGMTESHTEQVFGMPESHSTVTESHPHYDRESLEDTNKIQPNNNNAGGPALSEGQSYLLQSLGGKRLNPKQRDTILELERSYGTDRLKEVIDWAADRGMAVGVAVPAIKTAIPKWGRTRPPTNGSTPAAQENAFDRMRREMDAAQ